MSKQVHIYRYRERPRCTCPICGVITQNLIRFTGMECFIPERGCQHVVEVKEVTIRQFQHITQGFRFKYRAEIKT